MPKYYPNLLSPIKIGNVIFKNRMTASTSKPHYLIGSDKYPTETLITHFANKAKNGAAIVSMGGSPPFNQQFPAILTKNGYDRYRIMVDGKDPGVLPVTNMESYLCQMTEAIHFYGSKAEFGVWVDVPQEYDVSPAPIIRRGVRTNEISQELTYEMMDKIADEYALQSAFVKAMGFDMVFMHMSYRIQLLGRFLSPITNKRTDEFGGSVENMARFPIMIADRIKKKCGKDFLIQVCISGSEDLPGGSTIEDAIELAKLFSGHYDLLMIRTGDVDTSCPSGFFKDPAPSLPLAAAVKKAGADIAIVTSGGYLDLDLCEDVIASGKSDFIAMSRSWISNPEFGQMAIEGRGEDVVPCIRCQKCHHPGKGGILASYCSVNPKWGLEHKIERMIEPPKTKKKVAVVGGGPGGMKAALVAAERGHQVTLYEKTDTLGGLIRTADNVSFKWPLRDFKEFLIKQIGKSSVDVKMNTEVTPEMLKKESYDVVLAAVGSEPMAPPIPGADSENVMFAEKVYGNEDSLGKNVVIIGGGEIGVETGMHLAEKGHKVTVIEMLPRLCDEAPPVDYYKIIKAAWEKLENFGFVVNARCSKIDNDKVYYIDAEGKEQSIEADNVILSVGYKSKNDLAMKFAGISNQFYVIGDCSKVGSVQTTMRSAFSIASML